MEPPSEEERERAIEVESEEAREVESGDINDDKQSSNLADVSVSERVS